MGTNHTLREVATQVVPDKINGVIVDDLWDMEIAWKCKDFASYLPPHILKEIDSYVLKEDLMVDDLAY